MGASLPFFSGVARWATVGAHLGAMALPVMPIAPKCAPTNRWVRARMFEKLAAEAAPAKAQAASGCTAAEARRPGQRLKPPATAARNQQAETLPASARGDTPAPDPAHRKLE